LAKHKSPTITGILSRRFFKRQDYDLISNKYALLGLYALGAFIFVIAAYGEGLIGDITFWWFSSYYISMISIVIFAAPVVEEGVKNLVFRKVSYRSGFFFGAYFTFMEMLLYMVGDGYFQYFGVLDWTQVVRIVFPFHAVNYFTQKRFNFGLKGYLLAISFHMVNNYAAVFYIQLGVIGDMIYSVNFIVMALLAMDYFFEHPIKEINIGRKHSKNKK
jgi:hypothetical protein